MSEESEETPPPLFFLSLLLLQPNGSSTYMEVHIIKCKILSGPYLFGQSNQMKGLLGEDTGYCRKERDGGRGSCNSFV